MHQLINNFGISDKIVYDLFDGVESDLNAVLDTTTDLIVVSAGHSQYKLESTIDKLMALNPVLIYDTIGLFHKEQLLTLQSKNKVSILGRGDLK